MWSVGILLGIFVGILSGVIFLLILQTAFKGTGIRHATALIAELTGLATFSLGGSWFADGILAGAAPGALLHPYMLAFSLTFFVVTARGLYFAVVKFGNDIGELERAGQ